MRGKFITLYLLIVAISLFAIYWKMDRDYFAEKIAANESQSRSQLASLTRATEAELEGLTQVLDLALPILSESRKDSYGSDQAFGRFHMIAKVSGQGAGQKLDSVYTLDKSPVRSWGPTYATAALRNSAAASLDTEANTSHLWTVLDPNRHVWFLYESISPVTNEHYAALLPVDFLQGLLDRQKGQDSQFAIINNQAQVVAHSTSEYVGQLVSNDPLVQMLQSSGHPSGSGLVDGLGGERVHGFYEKVNGSNLFVTISTPVRALMAGRGHLKFRFLYLGLGFSLIGVCLILLLPDNLQENPESLQALARAATPAPTVKATNSVLPEAPAMPSKPPPPPPAAAVHELIRKPELVPQVEKFDSLFSESKVAGAMELIDTLEESPPPPPPMDDRTMVLSTPLQQATETEIPAAPLEAPPVPVQVQSSPPPPPWAGVKKPQIEMPASHSKLDEFAVKIRRPRGPSSEAT